MDDVQLTSYRPEDAPELRALIAAVGWSAPQIDGQLKALARLAGDDDGHVAIARRGDEVLGYVCAQFHAWNRLGQIHGLVVSPSSRRRNVATRLVRAIEEWVRQRGARGLYVDTPVNNSGGRRFYEAADFQVAYFMPEYYDVGQDGVTYYKFLR